MDLESILLTAGKKYRKLPPEQKLPITLLILLLIFILKISNLLKQILYFIFMQIKVILDLLKRRRRIIQKFFKKRLHHRKHTLDVKIYIPLASKVRYLIIGSLFSFIFIFSPLIVLIFLQDLPNPKELTLKQIPQTTRIYDRNKILLYEIYTDQNRTLVPLSDIPKNLQLATLAVEDKNFYHHPGFDINSIIRAVKENIINGKPIQGGSTITQQLIKSSFFTSQKKLSRKIKEIVLAFWTERLYTKDQILEMYFNQVPYGGTAWGVEAASEVYFGKHVKQLNLAESSFLAGLTQAPSVYSPYNPGKIGSSKMTWKKRQAEVLERMVDLGYTSENQAELAKKSKLSFKEPKVPLHAPHFVMYVKDLLEKRHGLAALERGGLIVITSLDLKKQEMAEKIVWKEVDNDLNLNLTNGAALVTNPKNGDILVMVGSKDYFDNNGGNVNLTISPRQPGSTVKVITYSAALMQGLTTATLLDDSPAIFSSGFNLPSYSPVNYDGKYFGRVTLRFALANSLNLPAVKTLQRIGIPNMLDLAKKMGISRWNDPAEYGLSLTLGSVETTMLDLAKVFGTLSNKGYRVNPDPILLVTDAKGNILEQKGEPIPEKVLPQGIAFIITDILSDNQTRSAVFGPNSKLSIPGYKVAVKTGTSDNKRDNWTIGYTNDYVTAAWVGNNDNSPMHPTLASGVTGAAPIWNGIMTNLLDKSSITKDQPPTDVIARLCFGRIEYFYKGTENSVSCGPGPGAKLYSSQQ